MHKSFPESVRNSTDLAELNRFVHEVVGKSCWKATFTYPDELVLHIGEKIPYSHPRLASQFKGEWLFGTCGSEWVLSTLTAAAEPRMALKTIGTTAIGGDH